MLSKVGGTAPEGDGKIRGGGDKGKGSGREHQNQLSEKIRGEGTLDMGISMTYLGTTLLIK